MRTSITFHNPLILNMFCIKNDYENTFSAPNQ